jgi:hypothetical protein
VNKCNAYYLFVSIYIWTVWGCDLAGGGTCLSIQGKYAIDNTQRREEDGSLQNDYFYNLRI